MRAVAHVHSTHSDGTATVAELRAHARRAGATVVLLTDHDTLGARDAGEDGWADGVLVVVGHEVSPKAGHLLVFGTHDVVRHAGRDQSQILDAVAAAGGVAYAAHPFSTGSSMSATIAPPHAWHVLDHPALTGVEAWSLTTDAAEGWASPAAAVRGLRHPERAVLDGPPPGHLERVDAADERRHAAGLPPLALLGGQDGHAPGVRLAGRVLSVMPHDRWMPLLQTELALDAPFDGSAADAGRVLDALRAGRTTIVVPPLDDDPGPPETRHVGDRVETWRGARLWKVASSPDPMRLNPASP